VNNTGTKKGSIRK